MKRQLQLAIAIMVVFGICAIGTKAQTTSSQTMRARVPFTFIVGEKNLPAGVYTVRILNPNSDRKVLQIRSENGRTSAIVHTIDVNGAPANNAKLVFRRYGDRYFFAQAQMAGDATSLAAARTRAERAVQRSLKRTSDRTVVAIITQ